MSASQLLRQAIGVRIRPTALAPRLTWCLPTKAGHGWDACGTARSARGGRWNAEFQVPLSQLRYGTQKSRSGGSTRGAGWTATRKRISGTSSAQQHRPHAEHRELHGISRLPRYRHIELLPHTIGRVERQPVERGNPYRDGARGHGTAGLDAKVGLTTDFTLDATVNPDFGQVEADPSGVNLTAYETFFEEKRPFCREGKNILTLTSIASGDRRRAGRSGTNEMMFYSRRIAGAALRAGRRRRRVG